MEMETETVTLQELRRDQVQVDIEKSDKSGDVACRPSPSPASVSVSWKHVKYQIISSNVAFLYTIHAGVNLAFSNLLLNDLGKSAGSWFASIGAVGIPIGAIACGPLMDAVGRKTCNLIIGVPCVGAWLTLGLVDGRNVCALYLSRLLAGVAAGLTTSNLVYVSETSHKRYRSVFLSLLGVHFAFGILLTTLLKLVLTWRQSALFFAAFFSLVALLVLKLTPESPIWLANFRADWPAAKKSLLKLNADPEIFEEEWRILKSNATGGGDGDGDGDGDTVGIATKTTTTTTTTKTTTTRSKYGWFEPAVYKPLGALIILMLLQQLSGLYATVYYVYELFPKLAPNVGALLKREAFVLFGAVRFAASVLGCCVAGKAGRKTLLIASSVGMLLALGATVVASEYANAGSADDRDGDRRTLRFWRRLAEYAAVAGFVLYVGVGAIGVMAVPWTLLVELLPTEKRAFGSAALISYAYLLLFATAKTLPYALDAAGVSVTFAFFALVSLLIAVFVHFCIPETLNRTLVEIESFYANGRRVAPPPPAVPN